jgi:signal transduction histidine kinase
LVEALAGALTTTKHPIAVEGVDPGRATWDPGIVEEILRNLITNATQATPDGGSINVSIEDRGAELAIHVDDQGPGFDDAVKAHLFEPWFTTKSEGVGLGLMLARKAARQHGGELSAQNRDGGGARFTLVLPREARRSE